jgi:putative membrane protein
MKIRDIFSTIVFTTALFLAGCAPATNPSNTASFLNEAAAGGMAEVQLASLALTRTQNPEIRQFALQMVTDHSKANDELKPIAASKSVTLPKELGVQEKSLSDKLSKLSGAEFDKEYVKAMVEDHEKDVKVFQTQAQNGTDADVKAFAAKTLPTLQEHLQMIQSIKAKM